MKKILSLILLFVLAACSSPTLPFSKDENGNTIPSITAPPWEAMVAAGSGASTDIDLETLNGPDAVVPEVAVAEMPVQKPKPTGNEITAVAVVPVEGTTGRGNDELTTAMRATLAKAGWTVVNAPAKNALIISGHVKIAAPAGATQKVSLKWDVQAPDGKNLGDIKQTNDVPAGSLDKAWGDSAGFATEAAATGIYELINKYR